MTKIHDFDISTKVTQVFLAFFGQRQYNLDKNLLHCERFTWLLLCNKLNFEKQTKPQTSVQFACWLRQTYHNEPCLLLQWFCWSLGGCMWCMITMRTLNKEQWWLTNGPPHDSLSSDREHTCPEAVFQLIVAALFVDVEGLVVAFVCLLLFALMQEDAEEEVGNLWAHFLSRISLPN